MAIDLKIPGQLTHASVAALIASKDDSITRQLRVTKDGIAFLSDEIGNRNIEGLAFRLESWGQGNGYCGLAASQDHEWVARVMNCLADNWPKPNGTYIDMY